MHNQLCVTEAWSCLHHFTEAFLVGFMREKSRLRIWSRWSERGLFEVANLRLRRGLKKAPMWWRHRSPTCIKHVTYLWMGSDEWRCEERSEGRDEAISVFWSACVSWEWCWRKDLYAGWVCAQFLKDTVQHGTHLFTEIYTTSITQLPHPRSVHRWCTYQVWTNQTLRRVWWMGWCLTSCQKGVSSNQVFFFFHVS